MNEAIKTKFYRWLFLLICLSSWKKSAESKEIRIVCYYTNWSVYRPGEAKFSPQNINPYLCTHLVYAFGGFTKENTLKPFDKYQDIEKGGYAKFTGLKTYNKNLKTIIAIGGWNEGSSRFSPMVASAERRKELVKNAVKFLRQNHFDGLDLDWEYPTFRDGGKSRDRDNYAQLVKELREEFERESEKTGRTRLLLTMAVPAGIEYINKGYDVPKLMKYLDWMNILSYDYHSAFEPAVNHHAPLYPLEEDNEYNYDTELNIDYTIKHYLKNGAIPDKLVLGIPTYGRSYTLFNPEANEVGAPADGPGDMGEATRENGYLAYYEICDYVKNQDWEEVQPNDSAMGPYAFKDNQWVGYDDENIVRKKAEYVAKNDLGGIMFWAIDNDDFRGNCHGRPYPLIEAAKESLLNAYGMTDENLIAPPSKPVKSKSKPRRTQKTTTTTEAPEEVSVSSKSSGRRRRIKTKEKDEEKSASSLKRRKSETSSYSSLKVTTPAWTTPPPPATPDMGGAFKCEEEGFFPHPKDCKKYFWCLAGAGDSGIVAHQFTCPAGLYFNKAADSCDYTQNVLCNKKLQKATTTTTTTEGISSSSSSSSTTSRSSILNGLFSTTRAPPKITAATSRTTFLARTTTTEVPEEEYEDEEYEDDEESDKKSSEEDPKVIKELIDLIRKAGGIDQLEKHLKIGGSQTSGNSGSDSTTQSVLSKSIVERVLSKTSQSTLNALRKNTGTTRNSAGPQYQGLESTKGKTNASDRGRLQYQNIARKRPTTEKAIDEEVKNEYVSRDKEKPTLNANSKPKNSLEYVNIRRPKSGPSTTEANEEEDSDSSRNNILGETSKEEDDKTSLEDKDNEEERASRKSNGLPQYVNIRRQRPSSTEGTVVEEKDGSTTSKYVSIRRSTTPASAAPAENEQANEEKPLGGSTISANELFKTTRYQTISRTSSTTSPTSESLEDSIRSTPKPVDEENSEYKYQVISRSTTTTTSPLRVEENDVSQQNLITKLDENNLSSSSTEDQPSISNINEKSVNNIENSSEPIKDTKRPSLFRPRPFAFGGSSTTAQPIESTPEPTKVSQSNINIRLRQPITSSSSESTPINVRSRVRGFSRFGSANSNDIPLKEEEKQQVQPTRTRKRVALPTEANIDYNLEQNRKYRPAELADLSSLTAADISLKGVDFQSSNRRRRPVSTTTTTEGPLEESEKTGPKTLSLARKSLQSANFNRRRTTIKNEDQLNASTELSSTSRPKRIFRTTTTTKADDEILESKTSQQISNSTPRPRKVVRRFRPGSRSTGGLSTTEPTISNEIPSTSQATIIKRKRIPVFRTRTTKAQVSSTTTADSIAFTDDDITLTTYKPSTKLSSLTSLRLPVSNQNSTKVEERAEPHIDILNAEEGENIKLSESNIREQSQINSFAVEEKPGRLKVFVGKSLDDISKPESTKFTEPSVYLRTRKIVRKLSTTEAPIEKSTTTESKRQKVIRRLKPGSLNSFNDRSKDEKIDFKPKRISFKARSTTTAVPEVNKEKIETKRVFRPSYQSEIPNVKENGSEQTDFNLQTTETSGRKFAPRLSVYTRTTPTTLVDVIKQDDDNEEDLIEDEQDEEEEESNLDFDRPKYTIYTTSTLSRTHHFESNVDFNDETESDFNDGTKGNKSMVSTVSKMAMNARNESEMILDSDGKLRNIENSTKKNLLYKGIERPSFKENVLLNEEHTQKKTQEETPQNEPEKGTTTESDISTENDIETTTILVDYINNLSNETDLKSNEILNAIPMNSSDVSPNDLLLAEITTEHNISDKTIDQDIEPITEKLTSETSQPTTQFIRRSTLKPIQNRPRFGQRRTTEENSVLSTEEPNLETSSKRPRPLRRGKPTTLRPVRPVTLVANKATSRSINRFTKKYGTTEKNRFRIPEKQIDVAEKENEEQNLNFLGSTEATSFTRRRFGNVPAGLRTTTKTPRVFSKPTEASSPAYEGELGIDKEVVKNRNKNLFSKRKMNTPFISSSTSAYIVSDESGSTINVETEAVELDSTTLSSQPMETTDYLTTLHHVFAEVENGNTNMVDSSTETMDSAKTPSSSKVERLIEVNRIVEINAKENTIKNHEVEEKTKVESIPTLDKIGEITRITVIKVVDGNNKTVIENLENNEINNKSDSASPIEILHAAKIEEVPNPLSAQSVNLMNSDFDINLASSNREERKFEIFGGSKVSNDKTVGSFPEIIDGGSHINVITSKPFINSETSTISLESLFITGKSHLNPSFSNVDEILDTDKSEFVNVRVLSDKETDRVPIIQTLDEEEVTVQAQVMEVTQKPSARTFKIVPIRVETAKNVAILNN